MNRIATNAAIFLTICAVVTVNASVPGELSASCSFSNCKECLWGNWMVNLEDGNKPADFIPCAWLEGAKICRTLNESDLHKDLNGVAIIRLHECSELQCPLKNEWNPLVCTSAHQFTVGISFISTLMLCWTMYFLYKFEKFIQKRGVISSPMTDTKHSLSNVVYSRIAYLSRNIYAFAIFLPFGWSFALFSFFPVDFPLLAITCVCFIPTIVAVVHVFKVFSKDRKVMIVYKVQNNRLLADSSLSIRSYDNVETRVYGMKHNERLKNEMLPQEEVVWAEEHQLFKTSPYRYKLVIPLMIGFCVFSLSNSIYLSLSNHTPTGLFFIALFSCPYFLFIMVFYQTFFYKVCYVVTNQRIIIISSILFGVEVNVLPLQEISSLRLHMVRYLSKNGKIEGELKWTLPVDIEEEPRGLSTSASGLVTSGPKNINKFVGFPFVENVDSLCRVLEDTFKMQKELLVFQQDDKDRKYTRFITLSAIGLVSFAIIAITLVFIRSSTEGFVIVAFILSMIIILFGLCWTYKDLQRETETYLYHKIME